MRTAAGDGRTTKRNNEFFARLNRQFKAAQPGAVQQDISARPSAQPGITPQNAPGGKNQTTKHRNSRPAIAPSASATTAGSATLSHVSASTPDVAAQAAVGGWGWLPALVLLGALGLFGVGRAMQLALEQLPGASLLFWAGFLLIFAPVALRMALPNVQRRERIALAVWLGLALFLVRVLRSPAGFIFHDEFPHYDTVNDILRTGSLFQVNSLQEVSALFPGLEIVTAALVSVSGLSIEAAGLIVIAVSRLIASLAIYLLYEEISGSPRVAGAGSVLAIAYPNYTYWSAQFSYESMALPLAVLLLYVGLLTSRRNLPRGALFGLALLLLAAVVVTHHLTSYFLVGSLVALFLVSRLREPLVSFGERLVARVPRGLARLLPSTLWRKPSERTTEPHVWGWLAAIGAVSTLIWLLTMGRDVLTYLRPHIINASRGFVALFAGSGGGPRKPFTPSSTGALANAAPAWEQLVAFAAVLLILALIPFGLLQVWRRYRGHAMAVLFGLASLVYPLTLFLRLARGGSEIANRSWDFLFVALGFVLAVAVAELWMARPPLVPRAALFAAYASVIYIGAFIVGMPPWARLPGPHLVGGDTRGLQVESYAMADWARTTLGPDNRFITDSTNKLLLGSFGEQYIVDGLSWVYISPKLVPPDELADLVNRETQYIVVDTRVTEELPRQGFYFEEGEPRRPHLEPLDPERLAKFEREKCLNRIYDSGHIIIYSVGRACDAAVVGGSQ